MRIDNEELLNLNLNRCFACGLPLVLHLFSLMLPLLIVVSCKNINDLNASSPQSPDSALFSSAPRSIDEDNGSQIPANHGHNLHAIDLAQACIECHASTDYSNNEGSYQCFKCHEKNDHTTKFEQNQCVMCHIFKSEEHFPNELLKKKSSQNWYGKILQTPVKKTSLTGPGNESLFTEPSNQALKNETMFKDESCTCCHEQFILGKFCKSTDTNCMQCHSPQTRKALKAFKQCTSCHLKAVTTGAHKVPILSNDCANCHSKLIDQCRLLFESHRPDSSCYSDNKWSDISSEVCGVCHKDKIKEHHPGQACIDCHWFN